MRKTETFYEKWNLFDVKELTMMYVKDDVLIFTDIIRNLRFICKSAFGISPLYSHSTSSFTWKGGLKPNWVEVEYTTDEKKRLLLVNNMRSGPTSVMGDPHTKRSETRKLQNSRNNNLSGTSMCQFLPTGNFLEIKVTEWNEDKLWKSFLDTKDIRTHGYVLKCDSEYLQKIDKKLNVFFLSRETNYQKIFSEYFMENRPKKLLKTYFLTKQKIKKLYNNIQNYNFL